MCSAYGARVAPLLLFSFLLLFQLASAQGQDVISTFVQPSGPLSAGSRCSIWLYCMNNSSTAATKALAQSLNGKVTSASGTFDVVLTLNNGNGTEAVIAPGAFIKEEYMLGIPDAIRGEAILDIKGYNPVKLVVEEAPSNLRAADQEQGFKDSAFSSPQLLGFLGRHLYPYEPIFFILGTNPAAEFQFSVKYRLFNALDSLNPLAYLYFGYTQTSFWNLLSSDPSFYDTTYKPSAFLYRRNILPKLHIEAPYRVDLQGGVEHESNGLGGSGERGLNMLYVQPTVTFELPSELRLTFQPRVWYYLSVNNHNTDLAEYRGYADLLTALSGKRFQLAAKFGVGDDGRHTSLLIDCRFYLPKWTHFNPPFQVQYFTGYGETLRQYNQSTNGIRAGICLWYDRYNPPP